MAAPVVTVQKSGIFKKIRKTNIKWFLEGYNYKKIYLKSLRDWNEVLILLYSLTNTTYLSTL